jgi:hypothetical protein
VVWNRLYFNPPHDSLSRVGVLIGPPNAEGAPKPTSSIRTISTFGAPAGGRNGSIGGNFADGSLALNGRTPKYGRSGIGRTSRFILSFTPFLESSVPLVKLPFLFNLFIASIHALSQFSILRNPEFFTQMGKFGCSFVPASGCGQK